MRNIIWCNTLYSRRKRLFPNEPKRSYIHICIHTLLYLYICYQSYIVVIYKYMSWSSCIYSYNTVDIEYRIYTYTRMHISFCLCCVVFHFFVECIQNILEHGRHHGWAIDALNSERIRPWTSSWSGRGCSELRTDRTIDVIMVGPWTHWTENELDHGRHQDRTVHGRHHGRATDALNSKRTQAVWGYARRALPVHVAKIYSREENRRVPMLRKSISDYGCVSGGRPRFVQPGTVAPNFWGGRRAEGGA